MSKIESLLAQYCPNGVEYKCLGELGDFFGGLTGKSKDDFKDGNAYFITYKNVYSNPELDLNPEDRVRINEGENQRTLEYGDVIFTGSSETPDECGYSSVVTEVPKNKLYLNSFCFIFRFRDLSTVDPNYMKHLFRSSNLRYQIGKTASGVTRFNVSKKLMEKVIIPIPPIEVQKVIASILDNFLLLSSRLKEEKVERQKQYEYYRDSLIEQIAGSQLVRLGDIATITRGGSLQKRDFISEGLPCIHYGQMYTHFGISTDSTLTFVNESVYNKSRKAVKNDIIMAVTSENVEDICTAVAWFGEEDVAVSGHTAIIHHNQNAKYLSYYFRTPHFFKQKRRLAHGTKVMEVTPDKLNDILIPLPSLEKQEEIVRLLDNFYTLSSDINVGIPAEIQEREKQYSFYRDKLLTFKESY